MHIRLIGIIYLTLFQVILSQLLNVFKLYHGDDMMYEMRRRKPETTLLLTPGIFNLPHHIGMVREELTFDDVVS